MKDLMEQLIDSNKARDDYVNREQDKFQAHLNRQRNDIAILEGKLA